MSTKQVRKVNASRRHLSPSASAHVGDSVVTMPVLLMLCFVAGVNFMGMVAFAFIAAKADRRADVLQLEVESFKNVLHQNGLPTAAHLPGESP